MQDVTIERVAISEAYVVLTQTSTDVLVLYLVVPTAYVSSLP